MDGGRGPGSAVSISPVKGGIRVRLPTKYYSAPRAVIKWRERFEVQISCPHPTAVGGAPFEKTAGFSGCKGLVSS
jgi:hypothetical protein